MADTESCFIRWPELEPMLPKLTRKTIWAWEKRGIFPQHVKIGPNVVGWCRDEVQDWINSRRTARSS
jgi:predicted DNA-binding transcriptional regulator AlpA